MSSVRQPPILNFAEYVVKRLLPLLLIAVAVGCGGRGANAPATTWTPYSPPDNKTFQLSFPGEPAWVDEPYEIVNTGTRTVQKSSLRFFKYEDPKTGNSFAVSTADWSDSSLLFTDEQLTRTAVENFAALVKDGQRGAVTNGTFSGLNGAQCVVTVPTSGKTYVFRTVSDNGLMYQMVAYGPTVSPSDPDTKTFLDSFQLLSRGPLPSDPPPTDELRPHAQIPYFKAGGFVGENTFVAVRDDPVSVGEGYTHTKAARYRYPSFRSEDTFVIHRPSGPVVVDGPRGLIYTTSFRIEQLPPDPKKPYVSNVVGWHWLGAYPVPPVGTPLPKETTPSHHQSIPSYPLVHPRVQIRFNNDRHPRLVMPSADGRHVVVSAALTSTSEPNRVLRLDAATLTINADLVLENPIAVIRESADGQTVFVLCFSYTMESLKTREGIHARQAGGILHEVDRATWTVRRSTNIAATPFDVANGPDKTIWITSASHPQSHQHDSNHLRMTLLDLGVDPPRQRFLGTYPPRLFATASRDRSRVYFYGPRTRDYDIASWDAVAATNGWTRVIASHTTHMTNHNVDYPSWVAPIPSPDGKCLVLGNGRACWLTGAGDPPAVDPAAAWTKW
jgi:hypothetical protein